MDTILAFLQPQLFSTVLVSVTTAWITATITSHSELIKSYREKRGEVYNELFKLLDAFRKDSAIALDDDFYSEMMELSNRIHVYGSKKVLSSLVQMLNKLRKRRNQYNQVIAEIESKHLHFDEGYDEATGEMRYCEWMDCDPDEIDSLYDEEKRKMVPTSREAKELVEPVLDALRKSELGFAGCLIGKFL